MGIPRRQALGRELSEELGVEVTAARPLICVRHAYSDREVLLDTWMVEAYTGEPVGREGQPLRWVLAQDLDPGWFPAADGPIISALKHPENDRAPTPADPPDRTARRASFSAGPGCMSSGQNGKVRQCSGRAS